MAELLREQGGLVSRAQLLGTGTSRTAMARMLRRRELVIVHPGVYVEHNGPLTWHQRAWAAVLHAGPDAALCLDSSLRAAEGPGRRDRDERVVHVAIDSSRRVAGRPGVVVHRMQGLAERTQWNAGPPRVRYEESVLDVAAASRSDLAAVAVLAGACGARRTTAARLLARLEARSRSARRRWLVAVLRDVAEGTCSVLEHGYQARVVRPHGLPAGRLQARERGPSGTVYRDVAHADLGLLVELDGGAFHCSVDDRDRDLERDLDAAVCSASTTLRLGYGQVFERGCQTAAKLAVVMRRLGWDGEFTQCADCGRSDQPS